MINIAIIGVGNIGKRHCKHANNFGNLVAVCDVVKSKANKIAKEYKCKSYSSVIEMLWDKENKIDLVAICTPNSLHKEHTITALECGYNVLCEKPMALTTRDCEEMIQAAEKANRRLFVVKQNRFNAPVQAVKKLIDENKLGKILSVHLNCFWNRNEQYYVTSDWKGTYMDRGILYTQFSHFIDLLCYLVGNIDKVQAMSYNFMHKAITNFPDTFVTTFKFADGALGTGHFSTNSYGKNFEGSITLLGENGTVKIGGQYLNELEYQNIKGEKIVLLEDKIGCNDYGKYQGSSSKHNEVYKNVINVLENKGEIMTSCVDGMKTIKIIEMIMEACQ